jgi:hypothetical protein
MDESGVHARDGERSYGYSLKGVRLIQEKSGKILYYPELELKIMEV